MLFSEPNRKEKEKKQAKHIFPSTVNRTLLSYYSHRIHDRENGLYIYRCCFVINTIRYFHRRFIVFVVVVVIVARFHFKEDTHTIKKKKNINKIAARSLPLCLPFASAQRSSAKKKKKKKNLSLRSGA